MHPAASQSWNGLKFACNKPWHDSCRSYKMEQTGCLLHQGLNLLGYLALSYLVLKQAWKFLKGFKIYIISRVWRTDLKKYGGWAVVTGATDGIGKAYAEELARRGFDIVLISRTLEKLKNVAKGIEEQTRRKTKVMQLDFTGGPEIYPRVEKELKKLDIGILVNNVGMLYNETPVKFLDVPNVSEKATAIMNCNMMSTVQMTRIVLPKMIERKKGLIINLSSEAGNHAFPMLTIYSATKAFLDFFSRGLNTEYKSKGITVQSVMPLTVSSNMNQNMEQNLLVKGANDYTWEALNTVGYSTRTSGCLSHGIQSYFLGLILSDSLMGSSFMANLVKRANKVLEKSSKPKQK